MGRNVYDHGYEDALDRGWNASGKFYSDPDKYTRGYGDGEATLNPLLKDARKKITALESQLAAANEAVRVLGEKHKLLVAEVDAWRTWKTRVVRYMTAEQPDPTPIIDNLKSAIAATDAGKAREGA